MRSLQSSWLVLVACVCPWTASAAVRLPKLFGDNMVLQQGVPAPVWGWADRGEKIAVSFAGQEKTTAA